MQPDVQIALLRRVIVFRTACRSTSLWTALEGCYPVDVTFANNSVGQHFSLMELRQRRVQCDQRFTAHEDFLQSDRGTLITYTTVMSMTNEHNCEASASVAISMWLHS
jgi:hypothetical protein